jgi:predicted DNA-binding transcriptional regulator AlpA
MKLITAGEVAEKFGVSESWVYARIQNRFPEEMRIPEECIVRSGSKYVRFIDTRIDEWIARGCKPVNQKVLQLKKVK